jgi:OmpA-OmpF porin, OOP family
MRRALLLLIITCSYCYCFSQKNATDSASQMAKVNVLVTDFKGKPSKGEQILLVSQANQKVFTGKSDAAGKFNLVLPPGDTYSVVVKSLSDTTQRATINIPALGPDEVYTEPFKLTIKFEIGKVYTLKHVHFDFGKATLRPESFPELEELLGFLRNKETVKIEIAGHTDNVGKDADNLRLSQQRADTIKAWLLKKGIAASRLTAKGYGATQPLSNNDSDEARQMNRRTEVHILSQ